MDTRFERIARRFMQGVYSRGLKKAINTSHSSGMSGVVDGIKVSSYKSAGHFITIEEHSCKVRLKVIRGQGTVTMASAGAEEMVKNLVLAWDNVVDVNAVIKPDPTITSVFH